MPLRVPLRLLACSALLGSAAIAVAWTNPPKRADASPRAVLAIDDLEDIMHGMDEAYEAVIEAIEKKEGTVALGLMTKMQQACINAKTLTPPKLRTVEEKDKPAFVAGYRKQMMSLLKATADLEIALVDGDLEKAKQITVEIDALQKVGHDAYKKMPSKK